MQQKESTDNSELKQDIEYEHIEHLDTEQNLLNDVILNKDCINIKNINTNNNTNINMENFNEEKNYSNNEEEYIKNNKSSNKYVDLDEDLDTNI